MLFCYYYFPLLCLTSLGTLRRPGAPEFKSDLTPFRSLLNWAAPGRRRERPGSRALSPLQPCTRALLAATARAGGMRG